MMSSSSPRPCTVTCLAARSTSTRSTPSTAPTSRLTAATQWSQDMPSTMYMRSSIAFSRFLRLDQPLDGGGRFPDHVVGAVATGGDGIAHAVPEVLVDQ